jgi:N-acetylmuramoyl-L-alanine amidase
VFVSPNFGERRGGLRPSLVVIHYTAMESCAAARDRLCDPAAEVSAHWLISETGDVEQLVDESLRAWHAGAGEWAGQGDVNSRSVGIELANRGTHPFPEPQMVALEALLRGVLSRWRIAPQGVIAHSDMAPGRKTDPGPRFDWQRLARGGLSVWPDPPRGRMAGDAALADPEPVPPQAVLRDSFARRARAFGYPGLDLDLVLAAFRLRFRPWASGPIDVRDLAMADCLARRHPPQDACAGH